MSKNLDTKKTNSFEGINILVPRQKKKRRIEEVVTEEKEEEEEVVVSTKRKADDDEDDDGWSATSNLWDMVVQTNKNFSSMTKDELEEYKTELLYRQSKLIPLDKLKITEKDDGDIGQYHIYEKCPGVS